MLPGIPRESGFETRVFEERRAIPPPFYRNLREQQAAPVALFHDQPMPANFDVVHRSNLLLRCEDGDLQLDTWELLRRDGFESGIGIRYCSGEVHDGFCQPGRLQPAQTPAQGAVMVDRDERTALEIEGTTLGRVRQGLPVDARGERLAGERKQPVSIVVADAVSAHHQIAAAIYPTTDDLSPDTSPESA